MVFIIISLLYTLISWHVSVKIEAYQLYLQLSWVPIYVQRAHQCQLQESVNHGHSLHWDGFIFFFNLLCGIDESNCLVSAVILLTKHNYYVCIAIYIAIHMHMLYIVQLLIFFQEYSTTYPSLGMTVEEFQKFLIVHQHVRITVCIFCSKLYNVYVTKIYTHIHFEEMYFSM